MTLTLWVILIILLCVHVIVTRPGASLFAEMIEDKQSEPASPRQVIGRWPSGHT